MMRKGKLEVQMTQLIGTLRRIRERKRARERELERKLDRDKEREAARKVHLQRQIENLIAKRRQHCEFL